MSGSVSPARRSSCASRMTKGTLQFRPVGKLLYTRRPPSFRQVRPPVGGENPRDGLVADLILELLNPPAS